MVRRRYGPDRRPTDAHGDGPKHRHRLGHLGHRARRGCRAGIPRGAGGEEAVKLTDLGPLPMPWEALAAWPLILLRAWVTAGWLAFLAPVVAIRACRWER